MTPAATAPFRRLQALCALALALLLAACGPGIGGTGTGTDSVPTDGTQGAPALAQSLCGSDLAPLLRCAAVGTAAGTTLSLFADGSATRGALLRVEGNAAELDAACSGWQFSGSWAAVPGQASRFHGTLHRAAGGDAQPGTLSAQRVGTGIEVQLFDAAGRPLTGPLLLQAVAAAPPAGVCP